MKAGRELDYRKIDALVAEHVMGWKKGELNWTIDELWIDSKGSYKWVGKFSPSTNISDAWQVVEKCGKDFNVKYISHKKQYEAVVDYYFPAEKGKREFLSFGKAYADTAPLAICKASLKAKGIDIDA